MNLKNKQKYMKKYILRASYLRDGDHDCLMCSTYFLVVAFDYHYNLYKSGTIKDYLINEVMKIDKNATIIFYNTVKNNIFIKDDNSRMMKIVIDKNKIRLEKIKKLYEKE